MYSRTLQGKNIMIATTSKATAEYLEDALKDLGATVVFSKNSPRKSDNISCISEEIRNHEPKIDALIIYNPNIQEIESQNVILGLAKWAKDQCSVIVCDLCSENAHIQRLAQAGAKYFNSFDISNDQIAFKVTDIVVQHNKSGRSIE